MLRKPLVRTKQKKQTQKDWQLSARVQELKQAVVKHIIRLSQPKLVLGTGASAVHTEWGWIGVRALLHHQGPQTMPELRSILTALVRDGTIMHRGNYHAVSLR